MKQITLPTFATVVALIIFSIPSAAKTKVEIKDMQGKAVGTITLSPQGTGVGLKLHLHDLPPGQHAIHFHQNPKCDAPRLQIRRPAFQS